MNKATIITRYNDLIFSYNKSLIKLDEKIKLIKLKLKDLKEEKEYILKEMK